MGSKTEHPSSRGCRPCPSHQQAARTWGIRGIQSQGPVKKEGVCTHSKQKRTDRDPRKACSGKLSKLTSSPPLYSQLCLSFWFFLLYHVAGMWDLSFQPGVEPAPPASEAQSLSHWTTRKSPCMSFNVFITNENQRCIVFVFVQCPHCLGFPDDSAIKNSPAVQEVQET